MKDWTRLHSLSSLVRPPGPGRDAHGGKLVRLGWREGGEGGEGDGRQGDGRQVDVVVLRRELVHHRVHHHLPRALRLDGGGVAQLGAVAQV